MASNDRHRYYSVLGLSVDAPASAIRRAYKKLAMKWHPDKCVVPDPAEAKRRFQEIQEAYQVLSDEKKKALYDSGLYDPSDDEEDIEGLNGFINEMSEMMADVRASEPGQGNSFEELQQLFVNMFGADLAAFSSGKPAPVSYDSWVDGQYDASKFFFMDGLANLNLNASKRTNPDANATKRTHPDLNATTRTTYSQSYVRK